MINKVQAEEVMKCRRSAVYFVQQYGWMRHLSLGPIRFVLWPWQAMLLNLWQAGKSTITNKSRQVGATWTGIGYFAWLINFHPEVELLVLSSKEEKAIKLLSKLYYFQDHLPDWLTARTIGSSKTVFSVNIRYYDEAQKKWIDGSGSINSLTTTGTSGAGDSARAVLIDEFALMTERGHDEEVWAAIAPTTTHGGQLIIISTPRGAYGEFYRIWNQCIGPLVDQGVVNEEPGVVNGNGRKNYYQWNHKILKVADDVPMIPTAAHYSMGTHDEEWLKLATRGLSPRRAEKIRKHFSVIKYDKKWRDNLARQLQFSDAQADQEFELEFEQLGNAAFNSADITACYLPKNSPWVKELTRKSSYYFIGVDTAEGVTARSKHPDYNSIVVLNQSGVQVYALHNQETIDEWAGSTIIDPATGKAKEKAGTVLQVIRQFTPCTVLVEKNGPGLTVCNRVEPHLPNDVYMRPLAMSGGIKPQLVSDLAAEMADEQLAIIGGNRTTLRRFVFTDHFTVTCLRQYIKTGPGKFSAAVGFYDDPVVALMWAAYGKRIEGALESVAVMPGDKDPARAIQLDRADDLTPDEMGAFGPAVIPKEDLYAGIAAGAYDGLSPHETGFSERAARSLGGRPRSLEEREYGRQGVRP